MKRRSVNFRVSLSKIILLLGVCIIGIGIYVGFNHIFTLNNIKVLGQGIDIQIDKSRLAKNLLLLETQQLKRDVLHQYPVVSDVVFEKQLPDTLKIIVTLRKPLAILESGNEMYAVDELGYVVGMNATSYGGMPHIRMGTKLYSLGDKVEDPNLLSSISFIQDTRDFISVQEIFIENRTILVAKANDMRILLPQNVALHDEASTLQTLIEGFRIKGDLPSQVDLRFEKPIVVHK